MSFSSFNTFHHNTFIKTNKAVIPVAPTLVNPNFVNSPYTLGATLQIVPVPLSHQLYKPKLLVPVGLFHILEHMDGEYNIITVLVTLKENMFLIVIVCMLVFQVPLQVYLHKH